MKNEINKPNWKIEWVKFDKEKARKALAQFKEDRATNTSWVNALSRTMNIGRWNENSPSQTPLAFDSSGNRLNGKHRLMAFVNSNLDNIVFPVINGLNPDEFETFDQNTCLRKHTAAHPNRARVCRDYARINWIESLVNAELKNILTTEVFDYLANGKWKKQIKWADEVMGTAGKVGKAPYVAAFMYVHKYSESLADTVAKQWISGSNIPKILLKMRDNAISGKDRAYNLAAGPRHIRIGQTFKILNALALIDQKKDSQAKLFESLNGLKYFSEKMRDYVYARWAKVLMINNGEEQ